MTSWVPRLGICVRPYSCADVSGGDSAAARPTCRRQQPRLQRTVEQVRAVERGFSNDRVAQVQLLDNVPLHSRRSRGCERHDRHRRQREPAAEHTHNTHTCEARTASRPNSCARQERTSARTGAGTPAESRAPSRTRSATRQQPGTQRASTRAAAAALAPTPRLALASCTRWRTCPRTRP